MVYGKLKYTIMRLFLCFAAILCVETAARLFISSFTLVEAIFMHIIPVGTIVSAVFISVIVEPAVKRDNYRFLKNKFDVLWVWCIIFYPLLLLGEYLVEYFIFSANISLMDFLLLRVNNKMHWVNVKNIAFNGLINYKDISIINWILCVFKWITFSVGIHYGIKIGIKDIPFCEEHNIYYKKIIGGRKNLSDIDNDFIKNLNEECKQYKESYYFKVFYCYKCNKGYVSFTIHKNKKQTLHNVYLSSEDVKKVENRFSKDKKKVLNSYSDEEVTRLIKNKKSLCKLTGILSIVWLVITIAIGMCTFDFPMHITKATITNKTYIENNKNDSNYRYDCIYEKKDGSKINGYFQKQEVYENWDIGNKVIAIYSDNYEDGQEIMTIHDVVCSVILMTLSVFFGGVAIVEWRNIIKLKNRKIIMC